MTRFTSREFNQSLSLAKKEALDGPVFVTDRGEPSHVLLSYSEYRRIVADSVSAVDALSMNGLSDIEFDPPKVAIDLKPADTA